MAAAIVAWTHSFAKMNRSPKVLSLLLTSSASVGTAWVGAHTA